MTDQRSAPDAAPAQMPAKLLEIVTGEGWRHWQDSEWARWYNGIVAIHQDVPTGELFFSADSEVEDIGEAIVLLQRIEQALAGSGGAGEGAANGNA